jgi:UDP-glucose 4-epimerase
MNKTQPILVVGGAGYIGSHVVRQLGEAGYAVVVYDNCSTGSPDALLNGTLVVGDLSDAEHLRNLFREHPFQAVFHFAGRLVVPESVRYPLAYYQSNTSNTVNLLRCCVEFGVKQFIFSSTAAVYGEPGKNPVSESTQPCPINPYGRSKLATEWLIQDCCKATGLRSVILRYFNVSGADPIGRQGLRNPEATHLIRAACNALLKLSEQVTIFGTDFPTPDGTAIRDYIHVEDLAAAHIAALQYLEQEQASQTLILNCGYGHGYSVHEIIDAVRRVSGQDYTVIKGERRSGDPACVIADVERIHRELDWTSRYDSIDTIVATALRWDLLLILQEKKIPRNHPFWTLRRRLDSLLSQPMALF